MKRTPAHILKPEVLQWKKRSPRTRSCSTTSAAMRKWDRTRMHVIKLADDPKFRRSWKR